MHILIINLTRLGDLLQTQPVIHGLKTKGHSVGLICLESFIEVSHCLSDLEYIKPFPSDHISVSLNKDWYKRLYKLLCWVEDIKNTFPADYILNLTPTLPARILAHYIGITNNIQVKGFSIDKYGFGISDTMWGNFFEATSYKRNCSPYNIVDIFRKIAHVDHIPSKYQLKKQSQDNIKKSLSYINKEQQTPLYVGMQLGASAPYRQWPVKHFVYLGKQLYKEFNIIPILFGHSSEQHLANEYKQTGAPCIDLIGKTSLIELASTLSLLKLLITNDTGTMHLAAGLGIPSLALFLATAQAYDTAPYLEKCCCIEPALTCHPCEFDTKCPHNLICHNKISPEHIWTLTEFYLKHHSWPQSVSSAIASEIRVWITQKDTTDFLDLYSISEHNKEDRSTWFCIQRHYYRQFLDNIDIKQQNISYKPIPQKSSLLSIEYRKKAQETLSYISNLLTLLLDQGNHLLSCKSQTHLKKKFMSTVENITVILMNNNQFNALGHVWSTSIQEYGYELQAVLKFCLYFQIFIESWAKDLSN